MQDIDDAPGLRAFWGEVHSNLLTGLGVKGVITNGAIRDFGMLAEDFLSLAGCVSPSHGFVQVVEVGCAASSHGLVIQDDYLLHADAHGAVTIQKEVLTAVPGDIRVTMARARPVTEASRRSGFSIDNLCAAMPEADEIH